MKYPFTEQEFQTAVVEWGCNCGPSALAFACQLPLAAARAAIPEFDRKKYTSPTMMKAALAFLNRGFVEAKPATIENMFVHGPSLVRIQWTGPWTKPGSNPKWAYGYTHWIATWRPGPAIEGGPLDVFDCNGGAMTFDRWEEEIVPLLTSFPRADGGWLPTHIWRLRGAS